MAIVTERPARLPGPNERCWCGSGVKYKKCHRIADESEPRPVSDGRVRPGLVSPRRAVPPGIVLPDYVGTGKPGPGVPGDAATRLARLRRAGRTAAEVLREVSAAVRPGVTTDDLDAVAHEASVRRGAYPSPLGYRGFPKSLCTSVNEVVLHGIPDSRPLREGEIVGLDVTVYLDGVHGDTCVTVPVGEVDEAARNLLQAGRECLEAGIGAVRPGRTTREVGRAIQAHADRRGYGVVREYCGHGIGEVFHGEIYVPHWDDPRGTHEMREGDVFTIEPMITTGSPRVFTWRDSWTVATNDGGRAVHFEHTVRVTGDGVEVLTPPP